MRCPTFEGPTALTPTGDLRTDPATLQSVQLAIDAVDKAVTAFWRVAFGYEESNDEVTDCAGTRASGSSRPIIHVRCSTGSRSMSAGRTTSPTATALREFPTVAGTTSSLLGLPAMHSSVWPPHWSAPRTRTRRHRWASSP
jgi:hypothetical protein